MKKLLSVFLTVAILLTFTGCVKNNTEKCDQVKDSSPVATQETSTEKERESDTEGTTHIEEFLKNSVDYNSSSFGDWCYSSTSAADALISIEAINSVKRGGMGSSFSGASIGICALNLSNYEDDICELIELYIRDMTAIQKDYFSLNWESAMNTARKCFEDNGEAVRNTMNGFNPESTKDFDIKNYSKDKLEEMDKKVNELFKKEGITKEWKNLPEFFFN